MKRYRSNMKKHSYQFLLSAVLLMMAFYCNDVSVEAVISTDITTTDGLALLSLKSNLINLDPSNVLYQNWSTDSSSSICTWVGVTCSRRHNRVVRLNIPNMGLEGNLQLVPQLGNLSFLVSLNLSHNQFYGSLPQELARLQRLRVLDLSFNDFGGGGPIPSWFGGSFPNLQVLLITSNMFTGIIPPSLSNMSNLEVLDLSYNPLNGGIPVEIGDFQNLRLLAFQRNKLTGPIPPTLFNISKLEVLGLTDNNLFGSLPDNICESLPRIQQLYLNSNQFYGKIPANISACSELWWMDFGLNKFDGVIPREIGNIRTLEYINLGVNNLTGEVPASLYNVSTLQSIGLGWNQLTGSLPQNLGLGLPNLKTLQLTSNNFRFEQPELDFITSLANCRSLKTLSMGFNSLYGRFPSSIGNLSALENLYAYGSGIIGSIPHEIGNLSRLVTLSLYRNQLTGSLPSSLGNLESLQAFDIRLNKMQGAIPRTMCNFKHLYSLVLSKNQIGNPIPDCIGNLTSLRVLSLSYNELNSTIPTSMWHLKDLIGLDLSSNFLSGSLAPDIGNLGAAIEIYLSKNQFSGSIPSSIEDLINLKRFYLDHNQFQGPIPEFIGKMESLEELDVSNNHLCGRIPLSMQNLSHLFYFNVSFNDLSGEIPSDGPFRNFSSQSFLSNKGLCGDSKYDVPPCPIIPRVRSKRKLKFIVISISVVILIIVLVLILPFTLAKHKENQVVSLTSLRSPIPALLRFSYFELFEATERFAESRLLGSGGFGSVYRGSLRNGKDVAVKVFNLNCNGAYKSFEVECKIFRQLRHRNLCKVIGSCSNQDFKALVLEYLSNGSLEKWLYSHNYFLNLLQRISIMIDVASALEYLHYGYSTPIIHCDLKPSNILLDENMAAHLSDFGISKLLDDGESITRTVTLGTMGYIAPEFGTDGLVSTQSDVYSYGILLMEVFTRMKPYDEMFAENLSLRSWINESIPDGTIHTVDSNLLKPHDEWLSEKLECVSSIFELALCCSVESHSERINIKEVRVALEKIKFQLQAYY